MKNLAIAIIGLIYFSFYLAIWAFIGYLCGLWLGDDLFSATIPQTHWENIWVYAWLVFWPVGLFLKSILWGLLAAAIIATAVFLHNKWQESRRPRWGRS